LEREVPRYRQRLAIRPGITGLAQVNLPPDTDLESVRRKIEYDLFYIDRSDHWLDLRIMLCTGAKLFGIPYPVSCRLLRLPGRETVERESVAHPQWKAAM